MTSSAKPLDASSKEVKRALRAQAKAARDAVPEKARREADAVIAQRVTELSAWNAAEVVLSYLPFGSEVDVLPVIEAAQAAGKRVALPRVTAGSLELAWHEVRDLSTLERGAYGILEPADDAATKVNPLATPSALCIVPGLLFDTAGFRLGYGGGYYDYLLYDFPGTSAGVARSSQVVPWLDCVEAHDRPVDFVVCEDRVI